MTTSKCNQRLIDSTNRWPPRGNYEIPARKDYRKLGTGTPTLARIKRDVDWARECLDHGRPDMADETLRSIWRIADALERNNSNTP